MTAAPYRYPYCIIFWDYKEPWPVSEFNDAVRRLLESGGRSVVFTEVYAGTTDYIVIVADRSIPDEEAGQLRCRYLDSMPETGAEDTPSCFGY